ncbi:Fe-S cluster assembly ATPase SufC [Candidatus Riesia pediculicola]|uniref:FeS assembly ATPase SufC n=1 Tax=Riesia pediculicola (strain USDA) TaxID=515618 RepID=D4G7U6_RIEPU|nr:Fe-S cluster assembly ATPase SufC [Candidatus Riesia pediculicola]ADD79549.1 FeS assembly ATPase SufC [Candidatus Riesia pediculicola USDA]ARC53664.1 ABC transporter ATP-binding protein [Candidatus Riesia pediculicola]QOJ86312.1 Fe-S cluster assembly ATPase SufC [Candidatus Riesia pediculicola]
MLNIQNLSVEVEKKRVLKNLNLNINYGEVHVIMGPNGSGKSTFAFTIAGKKEYSVLQGKIFFKDQDLTRALPEIRAKEGIFLAFQNPIEIPGVRNDLFLRTALNEIRRKRNQEPMDILEFQKFLRSKAEFLKISKDMLNRCVNVGFSGGEKKRNDILQMLVLDPDLCILDEIDSGLDVDSLKLIANSIKSMINRKRSFILITHHQNLIDYINPDFVHILHQGTIIKSGTYLLSKKIEKDGYSWIYER